MLIHLLLISFLLISFRPNYRYVYAENEYYARIMYEHVYLYRQANNDESVSNIYFELPKTYFVKLIDRAGDDFYCAEYNGITGYVKKNSVRAIASTPTNPYLTNISFRVYADASRDMRSYPAIDNTLSEQITYIPLYTKNIQYIASTAGQELVPNRTNIWYYCKFISDKTYYGYIYSDFCDEMTPIYDNNEQVTYVDNPSFLVDTSETNTIKDSKVLGIVIAVMCIPSFVFVILIIKGKHILDFHKSKKEIIDY